MENETKELFGLADALCARIHTHRNAFRELIVDTKSKFDETRSGVDRERLSENFGRSLRHLWIEASVSSTSSNYRSPPTRQKTRTATGRNIEFGYERDLQPTYLEDRCTTFFDDPPEGWTSESVLLSSGQSAMAAVLHALEGGSLFGGDRKLSFVHLGAYFETAEIFSLFSSLLKPIGRGRAAATRINKHDADLFIVEPVFCDGEFGCVEVDEILEQHKRNARSRVYIFDTTLTGVGYSVERELARMRDLNPPAVFRLISGLKLLQGGLELSSVGILTVFTPHDAAVSAKQLGDRIRKIRTLLGLGLSFADVAVLEAPWFLDREYTSVYQRAVFENNARLAKAVAASNRVFRSAFHPSMLPDCPGPCDAPYCVFRLQSADPLLFVRLEGLLQNEIRKRGILFESGGSFGFRGHRYDFVRPDDGSEPFLRIALGRRSGWSCDQITILLSEIASGQLGEFLS